MSPRRWYPSRASGMLAALLGEGGYRRSDTAKHSDAVKSLSSGLPHGYHDTPCLLAPPEVFFAADRTGCRTRWGGFQGTPGIPTLHPGPEYRTDALVTRRSGPGSAPAAPRSTEALAAGAQPLLITQPPRGRRQALARERFPRSPRAHPRPCKRTRDPRRAA